MFTKDAPYLTTDTSPDVVVMAKDTWPETVMDI